MMERFRDFWTKVISPVAHLLIRLGVSADAVTLVGTLGVVAGALVFFPQGKLLTGVLVISAFVFSDLLDGYMARVTGKSSPFGAFLDSTLDRIGDGAIFAGPALYLVLALICLVMGGVTSYARARAESLGFQAKVGIAERADRLVAILAMTGLGAIFDVPELMYVALWVLAVASTVTVVQRIWVVRHQAITSTGDGAAHG
jgi:CDP-diacylglycerol--glycerol-3-phosphate 3-phosphatidyltransferase